ncbi:uncharacterized protein DSM5745_00316 [Aspergillus mulundensis]|uniref:F-box domain-containing protein n=1 Tax=Aspergillus mulundensis TaxID=1810919 RepID=A0A3D8T366_9EURO|nr:Uncharacterized protein DSM5745_00316 [Aspergillus mulundensis]RDW92994.1 Uncharacterized protein DSM5745_00316 [Aspergillus mulundensis]
MLDQPHHPLLLPEIVSNVLENVRMRDLASCAQVNRTWSTIALKRMYEGSTWDMQFRTPDIISLNCLYVASRERFARHMGNVKHLLIAPENTVDKREVGLPKKLVALEEFRPMRDPEYAKSLFRSHNPRVKSLMVPFGIYGWRKRDFMDVFLTPSVEFLAIDDEFCRFLDSEHMTANRLENIRALTIYWSGASKNVTSLCSLLNRCNLRFFHIEDLRDPTPMSDSNVRQLIDCLKRQRDLRALALIIPEVYSTIAQQLLVRNPWPHLKALSVGNFGDRHWGPIRLPKFTELEMLSLRSVDPLLGIVGREPEIKNRLRMLHLEVYDIDDAAPLLDILPGCHRLQKLSLGEISSVGGDPPELYARFYERLPSLPSLECLSMYWEINLDIQVLRHVAIQCPQITILNLYPLELNADIVTLRTIPPLPQLKVMKVSEILFHNPRQWIQGDGLQQLAAEWRRIFPKLRACPTPTDTGYPVTEQDIRDHLQYSSEASWEHPNDSDCLTARLSTVLGHRDWIDSDVEYVYQRELETEVIGWPVVRLGELDQAESHSTYHL